jgi:hypothetical protein
VIAWRIYYDDESTFSSDDGLPCDAPGYGVEGILQGPPHDHQLITRDYELAERDFYLFREDYGCWVRVDRDGLIDHFVHGARHITACLVGRTIPRPDWLAIMKRIREDGHS